MDEMSTETRLDASAKVRGLIPKNTGWGGVLIPMKPQSFVSSAHQGGTPNKAWLISLVMS